MSNKRKADISLILVTAFWGISFYLTKVALIEMGVFTLNAFRFLLAFGIVFILLMKKTLSVNYQTLKYAVMSGVPVVISYMAYSYGILNTSISNAAFLCCMAVLFTPIFSFIIDGTVPKINFMIALLICIPGIAFITMDGTLSFSKGDIFCILCAMSYALSIIIVEKGVNKSEVDAFNLGVYQLGFVGISYLILALIFEKPTMPTTFSTWTSVLFLAIFCTGFAVIVQSIAQKHTTASNVGLIFTLEPIFASISSYLILGEIMTSAQMIGASAIILSIFILEFDWEKLSHFKYLQNRVEDN